MRYICKLEYYLAFYRVSILHSQVGAENLSVKQKKYFLLFIEFVQISTQLWSKPSCDYKLNLRRRRRAIYGALKWLTVHMLASPIHGL